MKPKMLDFSTQIASTYFNPVIFVFSITEHTYYIVIIKQSSSINQVKKVDGRRDTFNINSILCFFK